MIARELKGSVTALIDGETVNFTAHIPTVETS